MKTSAVAAAAVGALAGPVRAASDKVNIGWVGTGTRGYFVMEQMYKQNAANVKVVAVCDTYTGNLAKGKDRVQTMGGNTPETYNDFYKMLENKRVTVNDFDGPFEAAKVIRAGLADYRKLRGT